MTPLWLIPVIPLAGFAVNALLGTRLGKSFVSAVGVGAAALATVAAYSRLIPYLSGDQRHVRRDVRRAGSPSATCRWTSPSGWTRFRR